MCRPPLQQRHFVVDHRQLPPSYNAVETTGHYETRGYFGQTPPSDVVVRIARRGLRVRGRTDLVGGRVWAVRAVAHVAADGLCVVTTDGAGGRGGGVGLACDTPYSHHRG